MSTFANSQLLLNLLAMNYHFYIFCLKGIRTAQWLKCWYQKMQSSGSTQMQCSRLSSVDSAVEWALNLLKMVGNGITGKEINTFLTKMPAMRNVLSLTPCSHDYLYLYTLQSRRLSTPLSVMKQNFIQFCYMTFFRNVFFSY